MVYHSSHQAFFRSPSGAVPAGTPVTFRLLCDEADSVTLRLFNDRHAEFPMERCGREWQATVTMPAMPQPVWYTFRLNDGRYYGAPADLLGGEGCLTQDEGHGWQITVYDPAFVTPDYMKKGVMYQIFPDRFARGTGKAFRPAKRRMYHENWDEKPFLPRNEENEYVPVDFFGGNLAGITEKLPYLADLGVTVLYLNPIFSSASDHRYDTADYETVDPLLGTEGDLKKLCAEAERLGIHVLLDGVFSHTGDDSRYFNRFGHYPDRGACQGKDSPYYSWFRFTDYPQKYKCWWDFSSLPEVDKEDPGYREYMFNKENGIVPMWLKNGASGWRLDVADELSMAFLRHLRRAAHYEKKDATVLGEVWEDASCKTSYGQFRCYCLGDTLDSVMNYPLRNAILSFFRGDTDAFALARLIRHQLEAYPACFGYSLMNLLGSHDRPRAVNELVGKTFEELPRAARANAVLTPEELALGRERYVKALKLLCVLPGAPCVYYGDEAGLEGATDPWCRTTYPWGKEDESLQAQVRALLRERKETPLLQTGFCLVKAIDADTIRVVRYAANGKDRFGEPMDGRRTADICRKTNQ